MSGSQRPDGLYSTTEAAAELGVDRRTIADWKEQERVLPRKVIVGRGRGGVVPYYDLEDLRPLAEEYHRNRAATRRPEDR